MADRSGCIPGGRVAWRSGTLFTPVSAPEGLRVSRAPVMGWGAEPTLGAAVLGALLHYTGKTPI